MAASRDVEENHWPGFVDALTTMTMMLIFIMTILTVVIFTLSQSASRDMVEKVAKVVNIGDINTSETPEQLISRIMAKLETDQQPTMVAQATPQATPLATSPAKSDDPDNKQLLSAAKADAMPAKDAQVVNGGDAFLTVTYQRRATGLDDGTRQKIRAAMVESDSIRKKIELQAFADRATAVSDSRRIAFYRLLNLRTELIAMGVPADRIRARIEDAPGASSADLVRLSLANAS